ncbi:acetyl-CoA synthetase-like protein [Aureobasidium sp. EXF-12344]|nr:acetyl-CoA synthetase-like protein [Aureobasidium sp. EXF-12344]
MPIESQYLQFDLPNKDLWSFMFERGQDKRFSDDHVIYQDVKDNRSHTFSAVKQLSVAFGNGLRKHFDWRKGDVLSIISPNDIDIAPCTYGALYTGGIVSPANPAYTPSELGYMLKDSGAKVLLTATGLLPTVKEAAKLANIPFENILVLGKERDVTTRHFLDICDSESRHMRPTLNPDQDLAFLVYSSGTTGLPKGVMLSHTNIIADVLMIGTGVGQTYDGGKDRILGLTGLVHQPLHRGITTFVVSSFDLEVFCRAIQEHKVTFSYVSPPVLVQLVNWKRAKEFDFSSLRMLTSGAAPLTNGLIEKVYKMYGIRPWDEWRDSIGSIGKLFPNMTAKMVGDDGNEVAVGEPGELWLRGPNVFQGYWNRPKDSEEAISRDGYFKTGDVGHIDAKGNFYITDRLKELIKFNGFQVAPAELEGLLMTHKSVADVAVVGVHDAVKHTELPRAYIVLVSGIEGSPKIAKEIMEWMKSRVAYYKQLRGGIQFVDAIPKSPTGKILRRVIKDWIAQDASRRSSKL